MMFLENKGFTASDIQRYHSGQMTAAERHALEKAALDDPFLADALEGYTYTSTARADLSKIKARLDKKPERRNVVPFFKKYQWLSAAAFLIIVAGAGWFAFNNFLDEKKSVATSANQKKQNESSTPDKLVEKNLADSKSSSIPNDVVLTSPTRNSKSGTRKTIKSEEPVTRAAKQNSQPEEVNVATNNATTRSKTNRVQDNNSNRHFGNVDRNEVTNMNRINSPYPNVNYRNSEVRPQMNHIFNEMDSFKNEAAFLKERNGRQVPDNTIENFNIVLKPDSSNVAEVIVLHKSTDKKMSAKYPKVTIDTLEPAEGFVNFDDYIAQNLKMPEKLKEKPLAGEVQLSFDVDKNGQPTNITVVKSLCDKCDEEAIRLLKEGPKWKKKKNKKGKITIKF